MLYKHVNEFNANDKICLYGYSGMVKEISKYVREGVHCTYLKIKFDDCELSNTAYDNGWYGGSDELVCYGYIE